MWSLRSSAVASLLLLTLLAPAQAESVRFYTRPERTEVYTERGLFLGYSDAPITIPQDDYLTLHFRRSGYQTKVEYRLSRALLVDRARHPQRGAIVLPAASPLVPLLDVVQESPWLLALGLVPMLGVGGWLQRRRRLRTHLETDTARLERLAEGMPAGDPMRLARIGPYRIVGRLGRGGMAEVFRGIPDGGGEAVAIKVLFSEDEDCHRFEREIKLCQKLCHPSIVSIIDWGYHLGGLYLAMELIEGETLRRRSERQPLTLREVAAVMAPLFEALEHAHSQGVVHRDLKSDNVMLTASGRVVLLDFGVARHADGTILTQTGHVFGTPVYMAPEQYVPQHEVSGATDQYALGVMLFELLSGQRPFEPGEDPNRMLDRLLTDAVPQLSDLRPDLPASLHAAVRRMRAPRPDDRYPSVSAAWQAFSASLSEASHRLDTPPPAAGSARAYGPDAMGVTLTWRVEMPYSNAGSIAGV